MKLISWNVNGLRACMGKGFLDFVAAEQPDMLCLQETKMQPGQADVPLEGGYREYWNSAEGILRCGAVHQNRAAERHLWSWH